MGSIRLSGVVLSLAICIGLDQAGHAQEESKNEVVNKLDSVKTSVSFQNTPLGVALDHIREAGGGLNIHVADHIRDQFSGESPKTVTLKLSGVSLRTTLKLMLGDSYVAVVNQGTLVITTPDKVPQAMVTVVYDVRDVLFETVHFPGPRVDLLPPDTYREYFPGNGGPPLGGTIGMPKETPVTTDFMVQMIKESTGGETVWDAPAFIEEKNGRLWVRHGRAMQDEVVRLIALLRQFK